METRTCRATSSRRAANDDQLWRELCLLDFNSPRHGRMGVTWRALYKYNHQVLYDVLLVRRPGKVLDLGNGFILLHPVVMA
ncbi:hypothetical protein WJX81_002628 [Elliptochloris bilobata]|uniref:F-box protein n=1 Tax=Elliptochloris bilobata TaxID=381761 RepID=A0AAW1QX06_9CHLO